MYALFDSSIALLLPLLLHVLIVNGACDCHIDPNGNDSTGSGSVLSPFYSLSKCINNVQESSIQICAGGGQYTYVDDQYINATESSLRIEPTNNNDDLSPSFSNLVLSFPSPTVSLFLHSVIVSGDIVLMYPGVSEINIPPISLNQTQFSGLHVKAARMTSIASINQLLISDTTLQTIEISAVNVEGFEISELIVTNSKMDLTNFNNVVVQHAKLSGNTFIKIGTASVITMSAETKSIVNCTFTGVSLDTSSDYMLDALEIEGSYFQYYDGNAPVVVVGRYALVSISSCVFSNNRWQATDIPTFSTISFYQSSQNTTHAEASIENTSFLQNVVIYKNINLYLPPISTSTWTSITTDSLTITPSGTCWPGYEVYDDAFCEGCERGFFSRRGKECLPCPEGTTCDVESTHCHACIPGTYANTTGSVDCFTCHYGEIAPENRSVACEPCPSGHYTEDHLSCTPCPPDHFLPSREFDNPYSPLCEHCLWWESAHAGSTKCDFGSTLIFVAIGVSITVLLAGIIIAGGITCRHFANKKRNDYQHIQDD